MQSIALQGKYMSGTKTAREDMLSNVSNMGECMNDTLKTVMGGLKMLDLDDPTEKAELDETTDVEPVIAPEPSTEEVKAEIDAEEAATTQKTFDDEDRIAASRD